VSQRPRVVFDTSTLIGAILRPSSVPRQAFLLAVGHFDLLISLATLGELREVLHRAKFDRYTPLTERLAFLDLVVRHSIMWQIDLPSELAANNACRDAKDAKFLALALSCEATALVSSDADLLVLHPWLRIPILTPAAFLQTHTP
jgi:putative PIN family toxin of toxin-antitoxin system